MFILLEIKMKPKKYFFLSSSCYDKEETLDELMSAEPEAKKHEVEVNKGLTNHGTLYKY